MKRVLPLVLLLCLLAGCGGGVSNEKEAFLDIRARWLSAGAVALRARVRADYGERVYDYLLRYEGDGQRGALTVEEPALIQGVEAILERGGVSLRYDGALLDTGAILRDLSPLAAFPLQIEAWRQGSVLDCWRETRADKPCLTADLDMTAAGETETLVCRVWFDEESASPLYSELSRDGKTVIYCEYQGPE